MQHLEHFPVYVERDGTVFTISQQFGSTADDVVTIKITGDQAKQVAKFLNKTDGAPEGDAPELSGGFDDFWSAYPRKDGKARALDIWRRNHLHRVTDTVMRHLNSVKHTEQWTSAGGKYVPHAATYLSQRRYLDEVAQEDNSQFL